MKKSLLVIVALFMMGSIFAQNSVTFQVDMSADTTFNPALQNVYIAGTVAGNWAQPGSDSAYMLTPDENNVIYSITITDVPDGEIQYKYFLVGDEATWDNGEWNGDPNRVAVINDSETTLTDVWQDKPTVVVFSVDMSTDSAFNPSSDQVFIAGDLANGWAQPGTISYYALADAGENIYSISLTLKNADYNYKYFVVTDSVPSWDGGEWTGDPNRTVTVDTATEAVTVTWGLILGIPSVVTPTFSAYPNPVSDHLTIDNLENANRIEVYNLIGQKVKEVNEIYGSKVNIQTGDLSNGIYVISVYGENNSAVKSIKFVKK